MAISICHIGLLFSVITALALAKSNYYYDNSASWVPGFKSCRFQNNLYAVNSKFHPLVKLREGKGAKENICTVCTCKPTTLVQCEPANCPNLTNCSTPAKLAGECCESCYDNQIELSTGVPLLSCISDGVRYEHNEIFHPLLENGNSFCISCKCDNGTSICQNVSSHCPKLLSCPEKDQYVPEGHCCKACPIPKVKNGECLDERNFVRSNGETWSPVYGQITVDCYNCTCQNGKTSCVKYCPPVPPCRPDEPDYVVLCCPKCSRNTTTSATVAPTSGASNSTPTVPPSPTILPDSCDDPKYTHKVYLCHAELAMAIEDTRNNTVQFYNWLGESRVKNIQIMTTKEFNLNSCALNFQGFALLRRVNGLTNKSTKAKKIDSCTKKCANLVVRMLRPTKQCS